MSMTTDDRAYLFTLSDPTRHDEPTEAELNALMDAMLRERARRERDALRTELAAELGHQRVMQAIVTAHVAQDYWPILQPLPETPPRILGRSKTHELYETRQQKPIGVPRDLLGTFCKKMHLDEAAMRRVLNGEEAEHQGYRRCNYPLRRKDGTLRPGHALGQPYRKPAPSEEEGLSKEERRYLHRPRVLEQPPVQPPAEEFLAAEEFTG